MQPRSAEERRAELVELYREARACARCPLSQTRTNVVFGSGNADADLMFVGEAPGMHEDQQGLPFVGRAGKLLDEAPRGDRPVARRRVHRERAPVAPARQPRPAARRDRRLQAVPSPQDRADRAAGRLHARQLLDEADHPLAAGHHERPRPAPGARAGRAPAAASTRSSIPPRRFAARTTLEDLRADFARLPALLEEPPPVPVGAVAPVTAAVAARPAEPAPPTLFD